MRDLLKLMVLAACVLALNACGFQLRGSGTTLPADWQPLALQPNLPEHEVMDALHRQLTYGGVSQATRGDAKRRVKIEIEAMESRPLYLDAISRTAEIEYSQRSVLTVLDAASVVLHGPLELEVRRVVANDPDNPIGESSETDLVNREISEALARRILEQLSRWADKPRG